MGGELTARTIYFNMDHVRQMLSCPKKKKTTITTQKQHLKRATSPGRRTHYTTSRGQQTLSIGSDSVILKCFFFAACRVELSWIFFLSLVSRSPCLHGRTDGVKPNGTTERNVGAKGLLVGLTGPPHPGAEEHCCCFRTTFVLGARQKNACRRGKLVQRYQRQYIAAAVATERSGGSTTLQVHTAHEGGATTAHIMKEKVVGAQDQFHKLHRTRLIRVKNSNRRRLPEIKPRVYAGELKGPNKAEEVPQPAA